MDHLDISKYYKILDLEENASVIEIKQSYRKLSLLHHPDRNNSSIESTNHFRKITDAYKILISYKNTVSKEIKIFKPEEDTNTTDYHTNTNTNIHIQQELVLSLFQVYDGDYLPITINRNIINKTKITQEVETIYVNIPKGIDNNEIITLKSKGHQIDNLYGDVKLFITIFNNDKYLKRKGLDLIYEKNISLKQLLCGFTFDLLHPSGTKYSFNCNHDGNIIHSKKIKKMGFIRDSFIGNLYIHFNVIYPTHLSKSQINILKDIL